MIGPCFVDADVFVYALDPRDSASMVRRRNGSIRRGAIGRCGGEGWAVAPR
jgi:hypothetical protein